MIKNNILERSAKKLCHNDLEWKRGKRQLDFNARMMHLIPCSEIIKYFHPVACIFINFNIKLLFFLNLPDFHLLGFVMKFGILSLQSLIIKHYIILIWSNND